MQTEEELVETALLRYAQQRAIKWGADRFAAEFHRRDLEERWLVAARSGTTPYTPSADETTPTETGLSGPVESGAQENAVGADGAKALMVRPAYTRHSSVPRPPRSPKPRDAARAAANGSRRRAITGGRSVPLRLPGCRLPVAGSTVWTIHRVAVADRNSTSAVDLSCRPECTPGYRWPSSTREGCGWSPRSRS